MPIDIEESLAAQFSFDLVSEYAEEVRQVVCWCGLPAVYNPSRSVMACGSTS